MFQIDVHQIPSDGTIQPLVLRGAILSVTPDWHQPSAILLHVEYHHGAAEQERAFKVFQKNQHVPDTANHVGTVSHPHDGAVYHVFDVSNVPMRDLKITE